MPHRSLADLETEICELAGHIAAATCHWLMLVADFDRRDGWRIDGVRSMAHWLSWRCGFGLNAAREHVRVARALSDLPHTRAAFMMGTLSYTKVRAITRANAPHLDRQLTEIALHATGAQIDRLVAGYRRAGRVQRPEHATFARWSYDEDGCVVVNARLSPEDGQRFVQMWEAVHEDLRRPHDPPAGTSAADSSGNPPAGTFRAAVSTRSLGVDSLLHLAERSFNGGLGVGTDNERYLTLVHVDLATLLRGQVDDEGRCELGNGWAVSPTVARLLTCDGAVARAVVDGAGNVLDVGRKSRVVPKRLARALRARDRHCRFPSCTNAVAAWHHVTHWADGGPTDKTNLVGLCNAHHHAVHGEGFLVTTTGDETFRFARPDLTPIPEVPPSNEAWGRLQDQQPGLAIDAETVGGRWSGEKLHLHYAVSVLMQDPPQARAS